MIHGKYRIERLLAMGGFGAVYLGFDTKHGDRPVAIKDMICDDPQEFAIRLNFFRREAEILRSLNPVVIVPRVYDLIEQGQTAHLVMEFIRGQDLLKLMEGPTISRSRWTRCSSGARASATCCSTCTRRRRPWSIAI